MTATETEPRLFSTMELVHMAQVSYRRADYWSRTGRLRETRGATGSGSQRGFPLAEVHIAALMRRLLDDAGLDLDVAGRVARELAEQTSRVVMLGDGLYLEVEPRPLADPDAPLAVVRS